MKRNLLLLVLTIVMMGMFTHLAAALITIGDPASTSNADNPINRYYNNSIYEMLYTSTELGGAHTINKFALFKHSGVTTVTITNVSIYMRTSSATSLPTATVSAPYSDYTLVYSGAFPNDFGTTGWAEVNLTTPYAYDASGNLHVLITNSQTWASGRPFYKNTTTSPTYMTRGAASDGAMPTSLAQTYSRPVTRFDAEPIISAVQNPTAFTATAVSPYQINLGWTANDNTDNVMVAFNTENTFGTPEDGVNYVVNGGIDGGGTVIYNGSSVSFEHTGLTGNTQYFYRAWSVDNRDNYSPGTLANARTWFPPVTDYPYNENFDDAWVGSPAAPAGWTVINANNDTYTWVQGNIWISPTHSGTFAAHGMGNTDDYLITPQFDLNGINTVIKWWDRVENASYPNKYKVLVSTTDKAIASFTDELGDYDCTNVAWTEHTLDLSAYNGQNIYVAFHQYHSASTGYGFGIDSFSIVETLPVPPNPVTLNFPLDNLTTFNNPRLSWTPATTGEPTTKYNVYVNGELVAEDIATTFYQTTGLTAGESYTWKVEPGNVNGYNITATEYSFNIITEGYLAEGFDTTSIPAGWSNPGSWSTSATAFYHGTRAVSKYTTSTQSILGTPMLTIVPGSKLEFFARTTAASTFQRIQIKSSTDGTNWTDFGDPIALASNAPFAFYSIDLTDLAGTKEIEGTYLGFAAYFASGGSGGSVFVDHVMGPWITPLAPNAVTLSSPSANATGIGILPTLSWTPAATGGVPTGYKIYCDNSETPTTLVTTHPTTSYTFTSPLLYGRDYYWYVVATNAAGDAEQSPTRKFTTASGMATTPSPTNNAVNVIAANRTLGWSAVAGASGYKVNIGTTSGGSDVVEMVEVATNSYTHTENWQYETQYFWTVYTLNGTQEVTGTEWKFTVHADPNIYSLPWLETFEDNSPSRANWAQIYEVGTGNWTFITGASGGSITTAYAGLRNARFVSTSGANSPITKLVSPPFAVGEVNGAKLEFYLGQQDWTGDQNETKVYYRESGDAAWVELAHYTADIASWTKQTIDLPSMFYQIAFEGINNYGRANVIDEVRVLIPSTQINQGTVAGGTANITVPDLTVGDETYSTSVSITGGTDGDVVNVAVGYATPDITLPNAGLSFTLSGTSFGASTITITHDLGFAPAQIAYRVIPGGWILVNNPGTWTTTTAVIEILNAKAAGDLQVVFPQQQNQTLPVELSSFTAVLTADMFVNIAWVAESETNHLGYNILRSQVKDLDTALMLNPAMINEGSAAGTQMSYIYTDKEVFNNNVYYYWLESVAIDGSVQYAGPLTITLGDPNYEPPTPEIPVRTALMSAYPNPFNPQTNLRYSLKEAGDVQIGVYNMKGQLIRSYSRSHNVPGYYSVVWDGKDSNGKLVSSGVYFYRMNSGSYSATRKMMLMK